MVKLLGLTGYLGSGKDSFARVLCEEFGYQKFAMAGKLKRIVADLYGFDESDLESQDFKNTPHRNLGGKTPRFALQHLGTEGFRGVDPNTWVNYAERFFQSRFEFEKWVITDIRFPNEADLLDRLGGTLLGIERPSQGDLGFEAHSSEQHIKALKSRASIVFQNLGSLEAWESQARNLAECVGETRLGS